MKKLFTLLIILFAMLPVFSESLENLFEQVLQMDLEHNTVFYDNKILEFNSKYDLLNKKKKFEGKDIVIYMTKNSSVKADIKDIVSQLLAEGLRTGYYTYFGSNYYTLGIKESGKIVVGLKYNKSKSFYTTGYSIFKVYGIPTIEEGKRLQLELNKRQEELEKKDEMERLRNDYIGLGYITNSEVAQERDYNELSGKGRFTNKELEVQIANNKNAGLGAFIDAEIEHQREKNNLAGFGYKTDYEIEQQKIEEERLEYEKFLKTIFTEEEKLKNKICYLLGYYYDKTYVIDYKISSAATEKYNKLSNLIKNGKPGYGTYNDFQLHDAWKELLIDAEKYGTEYGKYKFTIGKLEQEKLDYSTRTATYSASIEFKESARYENVIKVIKDGYAKAYKEDWKDLPAPINWPGDDSVSGHQTSSNLVNGVAVYRSSLKPNFTDEEIMLLALSAHFGNDISAAGNTGVYNAFAHARAGGKKFKYNLSSDAWFETLLYDLKFNIVDNDGNELIKPKRYLPIVAFGTSSGKTEWKNKIEFEGIPQSVMEKIDSGNAHINLVAVYLEYGQYSGTDDTVTSSSTASTRNFIKNFPEIKLSLDKIEYVIQK